MRRAVWYLVLMTVGLLITLVLAWAAPLHEATRVWWYADGRSCDQSLATSVYLRQISFGPATAPPMVPADPAKYRRELQAAGYHRGIGPLIQWAASTKHAFWRAELRGAPFHCFWAWEAGGEFLGDPTVQREGYVTLPRWIPASELRAQGRRGVPAIPIWSGLLLNTIFWAALIEGTRRTVPRCWRWATTRRAVVRRQQGLCVACAYPREGLGAKACPECGHAEL